MWKGVNPSRQEEALKNIKKLSKIKEGGVMAYRPMIRQHVPKHSQEIQTLGAWLGAFCKVFI